jgi:hypothetical protein
MDRYGMRARKSEAGLCRGCGNFKLDEINMEQ